mgnify:CR=1 FL=1|jgi:hypothetical protein
MVKPGGIGSEQPSADPTDSNISSPSKLGRGGSRGRPGLAKKFNSEDSHSSQGG